MSFFDGFTPAYTFRLQIEWNDRGILDTSITARGEADEIAKAKQNIQRMLDEYTPDIKAAEPAQPLAADIDTTSEPEAKDTDDQHHTEATDSASEKETEVPAPALADKQEGARGLLRLRCPKCGSTFGTFLKEYRVT